MVPASPRLPGITFAPLMLCRLPAMREQHVHLAHSTLPASLGGGTWTEMELLLLPAHFKSPVNTAARGTSRDHTMQTALTSHAFSEMLFPERNSFHPMLYKVP